MHSFPRPPRTPSKLSDSVLHQLNMYALAAGAAGVGVLAAAAPAAAKIVYTKTHQVIGSNGIYAIDLNHDRIADFLIQQLGSGYSHNSLLAKEALGNAMVGSAGKYLASALRAGASIGPGRHFISGGYDGEIMVRALCTEPMHRSAGNNTSSCLTSGQWHDVNNRYLGLKFKIEGKTHYGWARLSVRNQTVNITGTLTGYAYETVANRAIQAGQTKTSEAVPINQEAAAPLSPGSRAATLGTRARGAKTSH